MGAKDAMIDGVANPWFHAQADLPPLKAILEQSNDTIQTFNGTIAFHTVRTLVGAKGGEDAAIAFLAKTRSTLEQGHATLLYTVGPIMASQAARVSFAPSQGTKRKRS